MPFPQKGGVMEGIKALRLPLAGIMMILLILLAGKWGGGTTSDVIGFAIVIALMVMATMAHNNLRDREHDIRKGRWLAWNQPRQYSWFVIALWSLASIVLSGFSVANWLSRGQTGLCIVAMVLGVIYSETRRIPLLPMLIVQTSVALPVLGGFIESSNSVDVWLLFVCVWLIIGYREILCDLNDQEIDVGWKQTLPVMLGEVVSRFVGLILLSAVALLSLYLPHGIWIFADVIISVLIFVRGEDRRAKWALDIGFVAYVILNLCR